MLRVTTIAENEGTEMPPVVSYDYVRKNPGVYESADTGSPYYLATFGPYSEGDMATIFVQNHPDGDSLDSSGKIAYDYGLSDRKFRKSNATLNLSLSNEE